MTLATLITQGSDINQLSNSLERDVHSTNQWPNDNNMVLNIKNFDISPLIIKLNGRIIQEVKSTRLLGVLFDDLLKWEHQITSIYKIVNSRLYLFKRNRNNLTHSCRIKFYYALIYSHFLCCCTVWGNASNELLQDLLILQKRSARLILDKKLDDPSIDLFRQLKWIPIHNIIKIGTRGRTCIYCVMATHYLCQ